MNCDVGEATEELENDVCMYISGFRARQHVRLLAPVMNDDG